MMVRAGGGIVVRIAFVIRRRVVVEGRNREQKFRVESVNPGEIQDRVSFVVRIAQAAAVVLRTLKVIEVRVIGDLTVAFRSDVTKRSWFEGSTLKISEPNPP